jgi:hypothetical protein
MRHASQDGFSAGRLILVHHPLDLECAQSLETYKTLLKPGDETFLALPLDRLVGAWQAVVARRQYRQWLADFSLRYLDMEASQTDFEASLKHERGNRH